MTRRNLITGIAMGAALALGIAVAINLIGVAPKQPVSATVLPSGTTVTAFSAIDHTGATIDQRVFEGQWDLVFFGFTHCPDVCPLTLQILAAANRQLQENEIPPPRIVLVSVDPERDTPANMSEYLRHFGDGNLGITGSIEQIKTLADGLYIYFQKSVSESNNADGNYNVDHSAVVLLIDPNGQLHAIFGTPHTIENFVHDLPILMRS